MGLFSWMTQDTNRSICCESSDRVPFTVYMHGMGPKGEHIVFREDHYQGCGVFGGKDYFELLSEMNPPLHGPPEGHRKRGIVLANATYPILTESSARPASFKKPCERCPGQGFMYDDEEEERSPLKRQRGNP